MASAPTELQARQCRNRNWFKNVIDGAKRRKERIRGNGFNYDAAKGDGAGCNCGFLLRTAAESSVMASPTGNGSMNVISELKSGFSYCSLSFFRCSTSAWTAAALAPEDLSFSIVSAS